MLTLLFILVVPAPESNILDDAIFKFGDWIFIVLELVPKFKLDVLPLKITE